MIKQAGNKKMKINLTFQMRGSAEFFEKVDEWRRTQPDIPARGRAPPSLERHVERHAELLAFDDGAKGIGYGRSGFVDGESERLGQRQSRAERGGTSGGCPGHAASATSKVSDAMTFADPKKTRRAGGPCAPTAVRRAITRPPPSPPAAAASARAPAR